MLSRGFTDIRTIAAKPETAGGPTAALERIRMIADACHNLPGDARGRRGSHPDPFAWAWQTAGSDKREWFTEIFQSSDQTLPISPPPRPRQSSAHPRQTSGRIRIRSRKRTGHS